MRRTTLALVLLVSAANATRATAQDQPARLFIDGAAVVSAELRAHTVEPSPAPTFDLSATVPAGSIAAGSFMSSRFSVRFETTLPARIHKSSSQSSGGGVIRYTTTRVFDYDQWTAAVLVGVHTRGEQRVQVGYLGGLAFVRERTRQTLSTSVTGLPPNIVYPPSVTTVTLFEYRPAAAVGVDVAIGIARHVGIVPQLRMLAFTGAFSIRPAIAVRWIP